MAFVDIDQRRLVVTDETPAVLYRVQTSVARAVGIDAELFVYSVLGQSFQHVASLYDAKKWPATYADAVSRGLDFYRAAAVELTFEDPAEAQAAALDLRRRLGLVVADWNAQPADFPGVTIETIGGSGG